MNQYGDRHASALSQLHRGHAEQAERELRALLAQYPHVREDEYDEWLRSLVETYRALGRQREAGSVMAYLHRFSEAHGAFKKESGAAAQADAARARELWAKSAPAAQAGELFLLAAREYEELGLLVQAALAFGAGGAHGEALRVWERVPSDPRLADRPYEQALAAYNLGLAERRAGRAEGNGSRLARAQRLLEEVADDFESRGERERAFDCYAILLHLGRELGSFENLAEGYLNCIRVLKADNLKFYVLQYYEDFLRLALEREELHAAATVFKEAADYARRLGLVYDKSYLRRSAETWWRAAEKNERDGGPVELSENAYLASIDAFAALADFFRVQGSYERLARLGGLPEARRARYRRVSERYTGATEQAGAGEVVPEYLKHQHAYPAIWELDLIEWELDGDPAAVCSQCAGDPRQPALIRRRALLMLLYQLEGLRLGTAGEPQRLAEMARGLGELSAYASLRPLEKLYDHPDARVRHGVILSLQSLYFKRTYRLLVRGFDDPDPVVRRAALSVMEGLHFTAAFDPLTRIFQESTDQAVKVAALTSIGRSASLEAGEFLIEVLRHEQGPLREVARRLLTSFGHPDILPLLRRYLEVESGPARVDLEQIVRGTGVRR